MSELKELLDILNKEAGNKKPKERRYCKKRNYEVERFIRKKQIAPGNIKFPTYLIYYHYCLWTQHDWSKKWGKTEFFRYFSKFFVQKRSGHQRYYLLNDSLEITEEIQKRAINHAKSRQKNKKKPKKVPCIGKEHEPEKS